jgi:hypothetical protein
VADPKIKITADTSQAQRELKGLDRALKDLNGVARGAGLALAAITAAGAAMGFAIKKTMDNVDELAKTSRQLGMTAADLQAFRNSAALAGVSSDELSAGLRRMQINIANAGAGTGTAKAAMDRLGISMRDLQGLNPQQQFQKIAEQVSKIQDPAQRSALATELLGKQGPKLLEAANEFSRLREQAEKLGIALSKTDTAAIERAGDAITEIQQILSGALQKAVADLAPYIEAIAVSIKEAIISAGGFEKIWGNVKKAIRETINVAVILAAIVTVSKLSAGVIALNRGIALAGGRMKYFNAVVLRNPLFLAVAAAIALGKVLKFDVVDMMDNFLGISEKAADIKDDIAKNAKKAADNTGELAGAMEETNQAAAKALASYEQTVAKLRENVQLQQEILTYGEEEAKIRQVIRQEQEKYAGASEGVLRGLIEQENSLRRQVTLQQEQNKALRDSLQSTSNFASEMAKLERLNMKFVDGMTDKEIDAALQARAVAANNMIEAQTGINAAIQNQRVAVNNVVNAEIARYDKLKALDMQRSRDLETINQILRSQEQNAIKLSIEQQQGLANAKIEIEKEYQNKILQLQAKRIEQSLMMERRAVAARMTAEDRATLQKIGAEERQKKIVADRIEFEKKSTSEKTKWTLDNMQSIFAALGAQNRRAFEANKALAVASALVNTYQGATKALATYPFPFNLVAAAGAVAAGMAQVAAIRSQQYSGRSLGGPVMGGTPYIVGENGPELFTPSTTGSITRNSELQGGRNVNVNFTIVANDSQGFDQLLTSRKGVITQIISDAMLERGARSMI